MLALLYFIKCRHRVTAARSDIPMFWRPYVPITPCELHARVRVRVRIRKIHEGCQNLGVTLTQGIAWCTVVVRYYVAYARTCCLRMLSATSGVKADIMFVWNFSTKTRPFYQSNCKTMQVVETVTFLFRSLFCFLFKYKVKHNVAELWSEIV